MSNQLDLFLLFSQINDHIIGAILGQTDQIFTVVKTDVIIGKTIYIFHYYLLLLQIYYFDGPVITACDDFTSTFVEIHTIQYTFTLVQFISIQIINHFHLFPQILLGIEFIFILLVSSYYDQLAQQSDQTYQITVNIEITYQVAFMIIKRMFILDVLHPETVQFANPVYFQIVDIIFLYFEIIVQLEMTSEHFEIFDIIFESIVAFVKMQPLKSYVWLFKVGVGIVSDTEEVLVTVKSVLPL